MIGKNVTEEQINAIKNNSDINELRYLQNKATEENLPTMQVGHNSDGTIKEEVVDSGVHDLEKNN